MRAGGLGAADVVVVGGGVVGTAIAYTRRGLGRGIVAAGHWGDGVTLAPFTGELVADILSGHASPIDRTLLSHERFETSDSRHGRDALSEAISPQRGARE